MDPATFTSLDEHLFRVQAAIDRHGVFHMCVLGDQFLPDYQYTIGFVHLDHPELTMFGLAPDDGAAVLQHLFERVRAGERFEPAAEVDHLVFGRPMRFLDVPSEHYTEPRCVLAGIPTYQAHTTGVLPEPAALQVVWADPAGRFPWEPGVDPSVRRDQPVLARGDAPVRRPPLPRPIDNSCRCEECRRERAATQRGRRGA